MQTQSTDLLKGCIFHCDMDGKKLQLIRDDFGLIDSEYPPDSFSRIVDQESVNKSNNFITLIQKNGTAFGWEMNVTLNGYPLSVQCAGARMSNQITIAIARTIPELTRLVKKDPQLQMAFNGLTNQSPDDTPPLPDTDPNSVFYNEIYRLNNDLVSLHRQLAKKNAQLESINVVKNTMMAIASHDIRNAITKQLIYCERLKTGDPELLQPQNDTVTLIENSNQFILNLVDDFLDISEIDFNQSNLMFSQMDYITVLTEATVSNGITANRKGIEIRLEAVSDPIMVIAAPSRITQILNNLLSNAIKYSFAGSHIRVSVTTDQQSVYTSVQDYGTGMSAQQMDQLFRPFPKTRSEGTEHEKSTGLGLYIVDRLIKAHGGSIEAKSEEGNGSVFTFTLPLKRT